MVTKGIITSIDFLTNTCKVRIPLFETASAHTDAETEAIFSIQPGHYNGYKVNDVVELAFEDGNASTPVVIGKLYLGANEEGKDSRGADTVESLVVTKKAILPLDTQISFEGNEANVAKAKGGYSSYNKLSDVLDGLQQNTEQLSDAQVQLISTNDELRAKVSKTSDGVTTGFGWDLQADKWTVFNTEQEAGGTVVKSKDILVADKDGLYVDGKLVVREESTIAGFDVGTRAIYSHLTDDSLINEKMKELATEIENATTAAERKEKIDPTTNSIAGLTGTYVGTDGIRIGNAFSVDSTGQVTASGLKIKLTPEQIEQLKFKITKVYPSIQAMIDDWYATEEEARAAHPEAGYIYVKTSEFVSIDAGEWEEETGYTYSKNATKTKGTGERDEEGWTYITDMAGIGGISPTIYRVECNSVIHLGNKQIAPITAAAWSKTGTEEIHDTTADFKISGIKCIIGGVDKWDSTKVIREQSEEVISSGVIERLSDDEGSTYYGFKIPPSTISKSATNIDITAFHKNTGNEWTSYDSQTVTYSPLNTPVIALTNSNASIAYNGNSKLGENVSTTAKLVYNGAEKTPTSITWTLEHLTAASEPINSTITISEIKNDIKQGTASVKMTWTDESGRVWNIGPTVFNVSKQLQGETGGPALYIDNDNDFESIPSMANGIVYAEYDWSKTTHNLTLFEGTNQITDFEISKTHDTGYVVDYEVKNVTFDTGYPKIDEENHTVVSKINFLRDDTGSVEYSLYRDGTKVATNKFEAVKQKMGEDGKSPIKYSIIPSANNIKISKGGGRTPTGNISVDFKQTIDKTTSELKLGYYEYFVDTATTATGSGTLSDSTVYPIVLQNTGNATIRIKIDLYDKAGEGKTKVESETVLIISDGIDGKASFIITTDNDFDSVPYDSTGNISGYGIYDQAHPELSRWKEQTEHTIKVYSGTTAQSFKMINNGETEPSAGTGLVVWRKAADTEIGRDGDPIPESGVEVSQFTEWITRMSVNISKSRITYSLYNDGVKLSECKFEISKLKSGDAPAILDISNSFDSVPCDAGETPTYTEEQWINQTTHNLQVFIGTATQTISSIGITTPTDEDTNFRIKYTNNSLVLHTPELVEESKKATAYITGFNGTAEKGTITYELYKGTTKIAETKFEATKIIPGSGGQAAIKHWITTTPNNIKVSKDGTMSSSTITIDFLKQDGSAAATHTKDGFYTITKNSEIEGAAMAVPDSGVYTFTGFTIADTKIIINYYQESAKDIKYDSITVNILKDGEDAEDHWIAVSDSEIKVARDGSVSPMSVIFDFYKQVGLTVPTGKTSHYYEYQIDSSSVQTGTANSIAINYSETASATSYSKTSKKITMSIYDSSSKVTKYDTETVVILSDGEDGDDGTNGTSVGYVFKRQASAGTPAVPTEHILPPTGWSTTQMDPTQDEPHVFVCDYEAVIENENTVYNYKTVSLLKSLDGMKNLLTGSDGIPIIAEATNSEGKKYYYMTADAINPTFDGGDVKIAGFSVGKSKLAAGQGSGFIALQSNQGDNNFTSAEYIMSNGTQYIDTGIIPDANTKIEIDFETIVVAGKNENIFGASNGDAYNKGEVAVWVNCTSTQQFDVVYPTSDTTSTIMSNPPICSAATRYKMIYDHNGIKVNETQYTYQSEFFSSYQCNKSLWLFGPHRDTPMLPEWLGKYKLYSCKIYKNNILVRNFVPVLYQSKFGLYDLVNNKFYSDPNNNAFDGAINADAQYSYTDGTNTYQRVEYIQSDGTQYVDTGISAAADSVSWEIDGQFISAPSPLGVMGAFDGATNNRFHIGLYPGDFSLHPGIGQAYGMLTGQGDYNRHTFLLNAASGSFLVDGVLKWSEGTSTLPNYNIWLFGGNWTGSFASSYAPSFRLYSSKIYSANRLVRRFVPVKKTSNGEYGLFDTVNKVFYGKAAGNAFTGKDLTEISGSTFTADGHTYRVLRYIQNSTIGAYIDTGWAPNYDLGFTIDIKVIPLQNTSDTSRICWLSNYNNTTDNLSFESVDNKVRWYFGTGGLDIYSSNTFNINKENIIQYRYVNGNCYMTLNNTVTSSQYSMTGYSTTSCLIFVDKYDGGRFSTFNQLWNLCEMTITENGTVARKFIPVLQDATTYGLFDLQNGVFYSSADSSKQFTGVGAASEFNSIYLGSEDETDAPFRVTNTGKLFANQANITGAINATSGNIGGFKVDKNSINNLLDDTLGTGTYIGSSGKEGWLDSEQSWYDDEKISEDVYVDNPTFFNLSYTWTCVTSLFVLAEEAPPAALFECSTKSGDVSVTVTGLIYIENKSSTGSYNATNIAKDSKISFIYRPLGIEPGWPSSIALGNVSVYTSDSPITAVAAAGHGEIKTVSWSIDKTDEHGNAKAIIYHTKSSSTEQTADDVLNNTFSTNADLIIDRWKCESAEKPQNSWLFTLKDRFGVNDNGKLFTRAAKFDGEINATSGTIGGFSILENMLVGQGLTLDASNIVVQSSGKIAINDKISIYSDDTSSYITSDSTSDFYISSGGGGGGFKLPKATSTQLITNTLTFKYTGNFDFASRRYWTFKYEFLKTADSYLPAVAKTYKVIVLTEGDSAARNITIPARTPNGTFIIIGQKFSWGKGKNKNITGFKCDGFTCSQLDNQAIEKEETIFNGTTKYIYSLGSIYPTASAQCYLGASDQMWEGLYAKAGTITGSDRNIKNTIKPLSEKYNTIFDNLKPVSYKLNDGTSGRTHTGLIAQDVENAILKAGLTNKDFAALIKSADTQDTDVFYSLRYEEFISLCIDQIQKLKCKVNELEEEIKQIKEKQ